MNVHTLQEQRAAKVVDMKALGNDLTGDKAGKFDALETEVRDLDKQIGRAKTLADFERAAPAIVSSDNIGDGQYEERARGFSITKAISAAIGDNVDAGFEREMSQEVAKRSGRKFQGIAVPDEVFLERRTLLAGSSAADLIPNVHRADLFIDRLRAKLVVGRLGATVLDGLVGNVDIPRQTGSSTGQWVAEDGSLTETDAAFDDVNLAPKTVGAMTSFSRRTLINAVPAIEQLVRNDLAAVIANAIDDKAIAGDGTSNTPTGILSTSGIGSVALGTNGAVPTWQSILDLIAALETANAEGSAFLTNPKAVKKMRGTQKVSATDSVMLQEAPGSLAGYVLASTNLVPSNLVKGTSGAVASALIFGNFADLIIANYSGTDILVNPYETTAYAKGRVMVRAMKDVDVAVRHAESFAAIKDMLTA
ncbi:phage major capsid protein [Mesorhizobium sp. WSM3626]|uniref:phage major capsid protein n=1 Tax=Mesorhizobium sp. WSM3626 TaxID=1040987 RepID=UPI000485C353|nr:phage major capsid protein [Mesorhizobium sp. WSM3626]